MRNNQDGLLKEARQNEDAVQLPSDEVSIDYDVLLALVNKNRYALRDIDKEWALKNFTWYYDIVLEAVNQNGMALNCVNKEWVEENPQQYYKIVLAAVTKDGYDGYALEHVNEAWVEKNSQQYYKIVEEAVNQNGYALEYVNEAWALKHSTWYKEVALVAVRKKPYALSDVNDEWAEKNPDKYYEIALVAVNRKEFAFKYASDVFRNNIKIIISLLINLDRKYSKTKSVSTVSNIYNKIDKILGSSYAPRKDILLYLYMLNNKNVSNNFKNALFEFFKNKFESSSLDKFKLYKKILECYLTSSDNYNKNFPKHQLLKDLSEDDSKQLHMFLSLADHSLMENSEFDKLLKNDPNDTIKNCLEQKDRYNLKSIKDFNIYSFLLPKNLFVIIYDKIINKMKNTTLNDNLIKLILCYSKIEDLLELSEALHLEDKLEVKYLDIDPKFERKDGHITIGIEAWVDAIKNDGSLSNTGKYLYDSYSTIYNSLDIEVSQQSKLIEYNL